MKQSNQMKIKINPIKSTKSNEIDKKNNVIQSKINLIKSEKIKRQINFDKQEFF